MGELKEELENSLSTGGRPAPRRQGTFDNIPARKDARQVSPPPPSAKDVKGPTPKDAKATKSNGEVPRPARGVPYESPAALKQNKSQPRIGVIPATIGGIVIIVAIILVILTLISSITWDLKAPPSSGLPSGPNVFGPGNSNLAPSRSPSSHTIGGASSPSKDSPENDAVNSSADPDGIGANESEPDKEAQAEPGIETTRSSKNTLPKRLSQPRKAKARGSAKAPSMGANEASDSKMPVNDSNPLLPGQDMWPTDSSAR
jgi:hypothetical protein